MGFLMDIGHARAMMHDGITNSLFPSKSVLLEKLSRHSRRMLNPQFTYLVRGPSQDIETFSQFLEHWAM